ncbi:DUF4234 domain-containing protein [Actinomadura parmotrematis]|uniref:DUF4234 domain-containing protein n=1 Tax=Actinomadura parmotrematis TaxID=2864039 RepID=A0ABS7FR68_9ACTN|nr:DUF4234 domain-containing protein [Actinomadura parmotrematis]MBW8482475.1 DUF4234 domain-containing protein [Actinomadura parmotrematis]
MSYPQQGYPQQGHQPYAQAHHGAPAPVHVPHQQPVPAGLGLNMKRRNPFAAWLGLPLITFGIYGLVWFYKVHAELFAYDRRTGDAATNALLSMILGFVTLGIWPLVMYVKLAGRIAQAQRAAGLVPSCSGGLGFLLGIFGFGVLYYQIELNKVIDRYRGVVAGMQVPLAS